MTREAAACALGPRAARGRPERTCQRRARRAAHRQRAARRPGRRGARGPAPIRPCTLLVIDEASMMPGPDLADLIALAETNGAKLIIAGDTAQLQAVQNGGGMSRLSSVSAMSGWLSRSGSAPPGNRPPACGCATATALCSPTTTSMPGSAGETPSRCWTPPRPPTPPSPRRVRTCC
ncbi:hypothetical protein EAS64_00050 [Trebonia kvetii]|uniref:Uncharacterized protein n=1 Tax=Trebonia kvetii TaxID=2480626 RepID=A0A6P2C3B3_9ACTN|nr:hypothetical protein EAS64_00050 [Trebonia kvetii]